MANTVQTDEMRAANIPAMSREELTRAADACSGGRIEACEACPFRPTSDCGGELIRALLRLISNMERECKTLLYSASTGSDLCELCAHNDRKELHPCSVNYDPGCDSNDPVCAGCVCRECNGASHFVWDDDPADNEEAGHE